MLPDEVCREIRDSLQRDFPEINEESINDAAVNIIELLEHYENAPWR